LAPVSGGHEEASSLYATSSILYTGCMHSYYFDALLIIASNSTPNFVSASIKGLDSAQSTHHGNDKNKSFSLG
jgi:hypothetical protein